MPQAAPITNRARFSYYGAGMFSLGLVPMTTTIVPLWAAIHIGATPFLIGLALGARAALAVPFSIHGGALMDRLGPRRIMWGSAVSLAVLLPLYPLFPSIWVLIGLQTVTGFTQALAWMGAQTQIAQLTRQDSSLVGQFAFVSTLGNSIGPPIVGWMWDHYGPTGAFLTTGIWGIGILACMAAMPRTSRQDGGEARPGMREFLPRLRDYTAAFQLALIAMVGLVITLSFLNTSNFGIRHSFYTVYLNGVGLSGTQIGLLFAAGSLCSSASGLAANFLVRNFRAERLLPFIIAGTTLTVAATPNFTDFYSLLALAMAWGMCAGISFPLTLYTLSRLVGGDRQGMAIGMRTTVNRLAGFLVPVIMGYIAEVTDLRTAFFVMGAGILAVVVVVAVLIWRRADPEDAVPG